jgi:hypothetical protein
MHGASPAITLSAKGSTGVSFPADLVISRTGKEA